MAGFGGAVRRRDQACPCGGGRYAHCCAPLHRGVVAAETAEQLMRSRYSAYALGACDYLLRTHPAGGSGAERRRELEASLRQVRWQRLEILATSQGGPHDLEGTVTFAAHYRGAGQSGVLRECSRFGREGNRLEGAWLYLEALELSG